MPTVKTQGGKIVTKGGKVSCECCQTCAFGGIMRWQIELSQSQYAAMYAGGTLTASASGSGSSTRIITSALGQVTVNASSSGSCSTIYSVPAQTCSIALTGGTPSSSVTADGSSLAEESFSATFVSDEPFATMSVGISSYRIYDGVGGLFPRGLYIIAGADYEFGCRSYYLLENNLSGPQLLLRATQREINLRTIFDGPTLSAVTINGEAANIPGNTTVDSEYEDSGTSSFVMAITFVSSAP